MLSHHRTNGLWDFYSPPKSGNGKKRCQLACDLSLLFCAFFNKCRPPRFTPSKAAGKQLVSERQNANMTKSKRAWDQDKVPHVLGWGPKPRFGVWSESKKKGRASCLIPPFTPPPSLLFFYFFKVGLPYLRRTYACEEVYPCGAHVTRRPALLPRQRGRALSDGAPSHLYPLSETLPCAPASGLAVKGGSSGCSSNGGGDGGGGGDNSDIMLPSFGQHLQLQPTVLSPQRQLVFLTMQRHDEIRAREV